MIFTLRQARAISTGRMTQVHVPGVHGRACPVRVGHTYTIAAHSKGELQSFGRFRCAYRSRRHCGEITQKEARAQGGLKTTDAWKIEWVRRHDAAWIAEHKVDLVAVYDGPVPIVDWILLERFRLRHAQRFVWVLKVELVAETPRFLAHPGPNQGDYTETHARAFDDLEVVDQTWMDQEAKQRAKLYAEQAAGFKRDLERERFERARIEAEAVGIDTQGAVRIATNPASTPALVRRQTHILVKLTRRLSV